MMFCCDVIYYIRCLNSKMCFFVIPSGINFSTIAFRFLNMYIFNFFLFYTDWLGIVLFFMGLGIVLVLAYG